MIFRCPAPVTLPNQPRETSIPMTAALIIAAGSGQRMHMSTPKQFLEVDGKPILVHTLERFQKHPMIDAILVVTLAERVEEVRGWAESRGLSKLRWVVPGGATGQESIRNGAFELARHLSPDDVVSIHDGIRPMVSDRIISENIETSRKLGNAITVLPSADAICRSTDGFVSKEVVERSELWRTQTPQSLPLGTLVRAHEDALARGWTNIVATFALLIRLGIPVHFSRGSETNVKITTRGDLSIFRSLLVLEARGEIED